MQTIKLSPHEQTLEKLKLRIEEIHMQYHSMVDYAKCSACTPEQLKIMTALDIECARLLGKKKYLEYTISNPAQPEVKTRSKFADQLNLMSSMQPFTKFHVQRVLRFTGSQAHNWISKGIDKKVLTTDSPRFTQNKSYVVVEAFENMV
jgi:hypothetical protein